ncbi:hypothetical protein JCM19992_27510 [Thermostilla marina]
MRTMGGLLFGWIVAVGCAGYHVGTATLFRDDIQTVYVPVFQSMSFRRGLGEQLTEAVQKAIETQTPYKVVGNPAQADSILSGRIVGESKRVLAENPYDDPRESLINLVVEVRWTDTRGQPLGDTIAVPLPPELETVAAESAFVPEVGQSTATAQLTAIERVADQIVGMMELPW